MDSKWIVLQPPPHLVESLSTELNITPTLARILINRNIDSFDRARNYFRPNLDQLHDPFLMQDMDKAVDRIINAINTKEKIAIYGDYDVDGTTSVAMLTLFLTSLGVENKYYIPNRLHEGYGLSEKGVHEIRSWDVSLIITTDCGITANAEVDLANELGLDVIICDHHEPGSALPNALAVLNPKRHDCKYPFRELAGVGVAFKLIHGIASSLGLEKESYLRHLDLVGIGSSADIVPLLEENRILVHAGLRRINDNPKLGIRALIDNAGINGREIGTGQIVFTVAPRINAVGRMGEAGRAVDLLISESKEEANGISRILESENKSRRAVDEEILRDAVDIFDRGYDHESTRFIVLGEERWHPGVIGIVASRLVEKYYRPTALIAIDQGIGRGSVRSVPGFDVFEALKSCEDLMIGFGGHKHAAGLTIDASKIPEFRSRLDQYARQNMAEDTLMPKLKVDAELKLEEITPKFLRILNLFAPFGPQNTRPVFMSHNLQIAGSPRIVGNNHLKFKVRQNGVVMDAIGFNLGEYLDRIPPGENNVDMVYIIEKNHFMGKSTVQIRAKDIR